MKVNKKIVKKIAIGYGVCMAATLALSIGFGITDSITGGALTEWANEVDAEEVEPVFAKCANCGEYTKVCLSDCIRCEGDLEHDHEIGLWKKCTNCDEFIYDLNARENHLKEFARQKKELENSTKFKYASWKERKEMTKALCDEEERQHER